MRFTTIPANSGAWHLAVTEFDGTTRKVILDGQVNAMDTPTGHNLPDARFFARRVGLNHGPRSYGDSTAGLASLIGVYRPSAAGCKDFLAALGV
jgi:hypothetical protein